MKIRAASEKNLSGLPIAEAIKNIKKFTLKTPAVMVNTLYGIGVRAAPNIAIKAFWWYLSLTNKKAFSLNT